jgi:hypothetical protein
VWISYTQVVDGLSALEVDVCCSHAAGACLSRAWLSEAVNPLSDSFPKFRKLFRSEYQQGDSEGNQQMHRLRDDPSNIKTIVSVHVTFFE